jgi:hypothetical protein
VRLVQSGTSWVAPEDTLCDYNSETTPINNIKSRA